MMEAALEGVERSGQKPILIAVTVLTSMNQEMLNEVGVMGSVSDQVLKLASLTQKSGLDGIVCSRTRSTYDKKSFR
jgi:orotidine-5'-phosphate decarboxylase